MEEIDLENLDQGFFASGLDSFDMGVIQNRLGRALGRTLPATLMLDLPTVKDRSIDVVTSMYHWIYDVYSV